MGLLGAPVYLWYQKPMVRVPTCIVDKTVAFDDYREHASLMWALEHWKVESPRGLYTWDVATDYIGYYPWRRDRPKLLTESHLQSCDLLYVSDTYGVYNFDLEHMAEKRAALDYSGRIFGGLEIEEALRIATWADQGGHLVMEFNSLNSPTHPVSRRLMEDRLGVRQTLWVGRPFPELSDFTEVPVWAPRHYAWQYGRDWDFAGPGMIFAHEDGRIIVLRQGIELGIEPLAVRQLMPTHPLFADTHDLVPYHYYFDIVVPDDDTLVLADYDLDLLDEGRRLLDAFGVPRRIPAITARGQLPLRIYLAGDFADNTIWFGPPQIQRWEYLRAGWGMERHGRTQGAFFWELYVPMIRNIYRAVSGLRIE